MFMKQKITKIVWGAICLFFIFVLSVDIQEAIANPELYFFGSGPHNSLGYKSLNEYIYYSIILIIWFVIGFLFCLLQHKLRNLKWGIIIHLFLTLLYVVIINIDILKFKT